MLDIFGDVPSTEIPKEKLSDPGAPLIDLLVAGGAAKSKGEARRAVEGGGIYVNNIRVTEVDKNLTLRETLKGKFIVLRKGARNYLLVKAV